MKSERVHFRIDGALKHHFEQAAAFDRNKALCNFLIEAGLDRCEQLRAKGWKAKPMQIPPDGRSQRRANKKKQAAKVAA